LRYGRADPGGPLIERGFEARGGALGGGRTKPITINCFQSCFSRLPDRAVFVRQRHNQALDRVRVAQGAQRLGRRLTHITVRIREHGQKGLRHLRIAGLSEELNGRQPDLKIIIAEQRQKLWREPSINAFRERLGRGQPRARFRVAEKSQQSGLDLLVGVFAERVNSRHTHRGVLIFEGRQERLQSLRIADVLQRLGGCSAFEARVVSPVDRPRLDPRPARQRPGGGRAAAARTALVGSCKALISEGTVCSKLARSMALTAAQRTWGSSSARLATRSSCVRGSAAPSRASRTFRRASGLFDFSRKLFNQTIAGAVALSF